MKEIVSLDSFQMQLRFLAIRTAIVNKLFEKHCLVAMHICLATTSVFTFPFIKGLVRWLDLGWVRLG